MQKSSNTCTIRIRTLIVGGMKIGSSYTKYTINIKITKENIVFQVNICLSFKAVSVQGNTNG